MNNIWFLFDCPDKTNDKKWLIDGFKEKFGRKVCHSVSIDETLSLLFRKGIKGKIKAYYIMLKQAKRVKKLAKEGDIIICWSQLESILVNMMVYKKKIILISMNWLTPSKYDNKIKKLEKLLCENPNAYIIVNSKESPKKWGDFLGLSSIEKFCIIPDVYNTDISFEYNITHKEKKYCFTGGMNNRDWKLIKKLASKLKDIQFVCVALESDFKMQIDEFPKNMQVYFNVPSEQYYQMMKRAYLVLIPLLDDKVAGLINIIRSAQYGVPCIITKTSATSQYYSGQSKEMLLGTNVDLWYDEVKKWFSYSDNEYKKYTVEFCSYIEENFSPKKAIEKLGEIII